jgi:hypothetical protein
VRRAFRACGPAGSGPGTSRPGTSRPGGPALRRNARPSLRPRRALRACVCGRIDNDKNNDENEMRFVMGATARNGGSGRWQ